GSEGWSLWKNRDALVRALSFEPRALPWLGALAGLLVLSRRRGDAALGVAWAVASLLLLLSFSPLHGQHMVVMIPPVAVPVGLGGSCAVALVGGSGPMPAGALIGVALAALVAWYATAAPSLIAQSGQLLKVTADTDVDPAVEQYADAVSVIRTLSGPSDYVV